MTALSSIPPGIPAPPSGGEPILAGIRPHFQPIVTSHGHRLFAMEALLRAPGAQADCSSMFQQWESTGEVVDIDALMVRRVANAIQVVPLNAPVSVNVSALTVSLAPDDYLREIARLMQVAQGVIVEITETYPLPDIGTLIHFARSCEQIGALVALDDCKPLHDFSCAEVVHLVRPQILKLDGTFLLDCHARGDRRPLLEIIDLANGIGAAVVAEHVTTQDVRDWVASLGAGLLQGYYFGAAAPIGSSFGNVGARWQ